jgi:hypothetical protein
VKIKRYVLLLSIACLVFLIAGCSKSASKHAASTSENVQVNNQVNSVALPTQTGAVISGDMELLIYENERFGFDFSYPDIFSSVQENEVGDCVKMISSDNKYSLTVSSAYDVDASTGKGLLAQAEKRISGIKKENSDDKSYTLDYESGDEPGSVVHETGYILGDTIVLCVLKYPSAEKEAFIKITDRMLESLKNQDKQVK